jgi:hypothetical protein
MIEKIKNLIFNERTELKDALRLPLCKKLYIELRKNKGEEIAKKDALLLCNDVLWAKFISLFENREWGQKYTLPVTGTSYDWRWVMAQLTDCTSYDEEKGNGLIHIMASLYASSVCFEVDYQDKILIDYYKEIRFSTFVTWPKLIEFNGVMEIVKIAPVEKWPPLFEVGFHSFSRKLRELIVSELYFQAKSKNELCKVGNLLNAYVFHFRNYQIVPEYDFLCRIKIELQEAEAERIHRLSDEEEGKTLILRRAGKNLDTNSLKSTLDIMLSNGDIPSGKRDGYVWYAVWLFFKKNRLLKEDSQGAFHRLMRSWFPEADYGNDDKMRIYNSEYLEIYNWQVWKYEEFKKTSKIKTSERGFNAIKKLYEELEHSINIADLWVGLY